MTAPSSTSSARSSRNYLEARDSRQDALAQALSTGHPATLFLSLNIPGSKKTPPGAEALFLWMREKLHAGFPGLACLTEARDVLGPYALFGLDIDPPVVKKRCVGLETDHPSARLIDLDVYAADGRQIDLVSLGLQGRSCLVCDQQAVDCIRAKRHAFEETICKVHELLAPFRT